MCKNVFKKLKSFYNSDIDKELEYEVSVSKELIVFAVITAMIILALIFV